MQKEFSERVRKMISQDQTVIGLAAAGSYIYNQLDEYSDLDLVLITEEKIGGNKDAMISYAGSFGDLVSGFTGEHVGEPRVLICLFDNPLLHVDIKFLTLQEFHERVENPIILFERDGRLSEVLSKTKPCWPRPDFQWIEDRFWTWVHYGVLKIGRGEFFEAIDAISFLRAQVISPLLLIEHNKPPRGLRRVEMELSARGLKYLQSTVAVYDRQSIIAAMENTIAIYRELRQKLFDNTIRWQVRAEELSVGYLGLVR